MNVTLQEQDARVIYSLPPGLKEICADITREVLRAQPDNLYQFIAEYLNGLLMTQDSAQAATLLIHDMLSNDVTYEAMLAHRGVSESLANAAALVVQAAYRGYLARKYVKNLRDYKGRVLERYLDSLGMNLDVANLRAIKIQAAFRGHLARRALKLTFFHDDVEVVDEKEEIDADILGKILESMGISLEDATAASVIIQRKYRQYRAKKVPNKMSLSKRQVLAQHVRELLKSSKSNKLLSSKDDMSMQTLSHGDSQSQSDKLIAASKSGLKSIGSQHVDAADVKLRTESDRDETDASTGIGDAMIEAGEGSDSSSEGEDEIDTSTLISILIPSSGDTDHEDVEGGDEKH